MMWLIATGTTNLLDDALWLHDSSACGSCCVSYRAETRSLSRDAALSALLQRHLEARCFEGLIIRREAVGHVRTNQTR